MSKVIRLKKGFDIKILGHAAAKTETTFESSTFAVKPIDFHGIAPIPKLMVAPGDEVLAGDPLFFDKAHPDIKYTSPVSGEIAEIRRGEKRRITEVVVLADKQNRFKAFDKVNPADLDRDSIIERLLNSGAWLFLKQRPFNIIADPTEHPRNIFISGFDTAPLAPDYNYMFADRKVDFQAGVEALAKLTEGKVHLSLNAQIKPCAAFDEAANLQIHWFEGPHPAGCVGVQIHHIDPILKGDVVWTIGPMDVANIGRLFLDGRYEPCRMVAATGPEIKRARYFKTLLGANISGMVKNNLHKSHVRYISGNVLSGMAIGGDDHMGFYDNQLTVLEEGDQPELFGWLFPSYPRPTASKAFTPILNDIGEGYYVNTNLHGEERAFVMSGQYEEVLPMDIYPVHLLKSILYKDFELMEGLGIYEVVEEDLAICEFVCTSKTQVQEILRNGLDYIWSQG